MDSVLTYMVDNSIDPALELQKSLKKILNRDHIYLFRDIDRSFETLIGSFNAVNGSEVIISALASFSYYKIIESYGYIPIVIDVSLDSGLPTVEDFKKSITENTILLVNTYNFCVHPVGLELGLLGVPVLEVFLSGLGENSEGKITGSDCNFSIISLEESSIINSMGGSIFVSESDSGDYISLQLKNRPEMRLQGLNASFALSQLADLSIFLNKQKYLVEIYKASLLKSGYYTFENGEATSYSHFPVIVKKSLKDIQKYCRSHGIESIKAFSNSIVGNIQVKAVNAKSLSTRTLLFPISLSMKKITIELISRILSTLP